MLFVPLIAALRPTVRLGKQMYYV